MFAANAQRVKRRVSRHCGEKENLVNKKSFLAYIIVLVLVLCQSLIAQDGTEHFKQFSVSVGAGIPYSGLGANAEIYPIEYFGIDLGLGTYGRDVIGLIVGGRILILDQNSILRPFLSAHYGTIGQSKKKLITKKVNGYYDWSSAYAKPTGITGTAIGLGLRLRIDRKSVV